MHIYHNEKVDLPKYFRAELYQFMYGMRTNFAQYNHNWYEKFDVGKSPRSFPIYSEMCEITYYSPKTEHAFASLFLITEWFLMARVNNCVWYHMNHIECRDNCLIIFYFNTSIQIKRILVSAHLGMQNIPPRTQWFYQWIHWPCICIYIPRNLWGIWNCFLVCHSITSTQRWLVIP